MELVLFASWWKGVQFSLYTCMRIIIIIIIIFVARSLRNDSFHEHVEVEVKMRVTVRQFYSLLSNRKCDVFLHLTASPSLIVVDSFPFVHFWGKRFTVTAKPPRRRTQFTHKRLLANICMDGKCSVGGDSLTLQENGIPGLCVCLNATQCGCVHVGKWVGGGGGVGALAVCHLKIVKSCGCNQIILGKRTYE